MSGAWIFVCGPSGAGKDSVIAWARQDLDNHPDVVFARRVVTRAMQVGSDHDPIAEVDFHAQVANGSLRWHWQAHGFFYGVLDHYANDVKAGRLVVVNGSRAHINEMPASPEVRVVQVTAAPEQLALRMNQRARDTASSVAARLARNALFGGMQADCQIVNDSYLATAGKQLADYLRDSLVIQQA
jgi:phosphonate metabolism protein PhnN/1,5-bisphosphokinase (PRPP-forming)